MNERAGGGSGSDSSFSAITIKKEKDLWGTVDHWRADHHPCGPAPPTTSLHLVFFFLQCSGVDLLAVYTQELY